MSALLERLQADLNAARKGSDKPRTLLIGTILAETKNRRIELQRDLTDDDVVDVLRKQIKRRRESEQAFTQGNRADLAEKEKGEAAALETYLPPSVHDDELRTAVRAAVAGGAANIGAVMGKVMAQYKGRADGSVINRIAREELAAKG
jgi:uncharacterized protein YqeY